ncbi:hypothetical protein CN495_08490 [Bacillus thuringiensis]|uniref:N-acetyltransferase domain-containing protein n=1 Tax=Bacillus thuringiensis TaxID=1428 RepID=A0ABD6SA15_BACTU|nr:GNAT family N-acetyltransferase [Bacillus thuringiensis]PER55780.1 hypothetical protein CN495_08490 [Bacillus thuringiensis]
MVNELNADGKKTDVAINNVHVGYVVFRVVDESNREGFLAENRYVQEFIHLLPETFGVIDKIYIKECEQGKGFGTQIMNQVLETFKGKVNIIHLLPHPISEVKKQMDGMQFHLARLRLVDFYKRFGFLLDDTRYVDLKNLKVAHLRPMFLTLSDEGRE